jgi:Fe2+ transport system protein A
MAIYQRRESMKLTDAKEGYQGRVLSMDGDNHMISRAVSIGIVPGGVVKLLKNRRKQPVLIYSRDSMIALNREDAANIIVE